MRTFLVSMKETKYYVVETENDDLTPAMMADEFLAHDGNHVMMMTLAGTGQKEMEVIELGDPNQHFYGVEEDGDNDGDWVSN